jgi:hypothetical protein
VSHEIIPENREVCNAYGYHSGRIDGVKEMKRGSKAQIKGSDTSECEYKKNEKKCPKLLSVRSHGHPA